MGDCPGFDLAVKTKKKKKESDSNRHARLYILGGGASSLTDFWNFSRNSWAFVFSDRETFPCMVATAARIGPKACAAVPSLLAIVGELGKEGGRGYLVIVDRRDREEGFRQWW